MADESYFPPSVYESATPAAAPPGRPTQTAPEAPPSATDYFGTPSYGTPTQASGPPQFTPAENPTRWSELARTGEFIGPEAMADVPYAVGKQLESGIGRLTQPLGDDWWETAKTMPSRGLGALEVAGSPFAGVITGGGHLFAGALHAVGSLISPKLAALDVPDTLQQPRSEPAGISSILTPEIARPQFEADKPRALFSQVGQPVAELASMLGVPKGATPKGMTGAAAFEPGTGEALKDVGGQGYDAVRKMGVRYEPSAVQKFVADQKQALINEGLPAYNKNAQITWRALNDLGKVKNPTFSDIELAQRTIKKGADAASRFAVQAIDDFVINPPQGAMLVPPNVAKQAVEQMGVNRANWRQGSKAEYLDELLESARSKAANPNAPVPENVTLQRFASKMLDPRDAMHKELRNWSPAEVNQLRKVQQGTWPGWIMQQIGHFAPDVPSGANLQSMWAMPKLAAHIWNSYANPFVGVPVAMGTKLAEHLGETSTLRNWEKLSRIIRKAAPAAQQTATVAPRSIWTSAVPQAAILASHLAKTYGQ